MTTITETLPTLVNVPTTADPDNFDAYADNLLGTQLPALITSFNTASGQYNTVAGEVNTDALTATTQAGIATAQALLAQGFAGESEDAADASAASAAFKGEWSLLTGALAVPSSVAHNGAIWVLLTSLADVTASEPGVDADWALLSGTPRETRTANTILTTIDKGKIIDITSGTFTQTFTQAATLGNNWFVYLKNSGTGDITLDPDSTEEIDGLTSYVMYPGEMRMVVCTGTGFVTYLLAGFRKVFTASGTFTKPPGYTDIDAEVWGAGSSGERSGSGTGASGGGGGSYSRRTIAYATVGATETATVGAGGAAVTTTGWNSGGTSTFGALVSAQGGQLGAGGASEGFTQNLATAGQGSTVSPTQNATFLGGGAASSDRSTNSGNGYFGGGAGGSIDNAGVLRTAGASLRGGAGGAAADTTNGVAGTQPAGGGGATKTGTASGKGGDGLIIVRGIF
jgi:hypothetical protein